MPSIPGIKVPSIVFMSDFSKSFQTLNFVLSITNVA